MMKTSYARDHHDETRRDAYDPVDQFIFASSARATFSTIALSRAVTVAAYFLLVDRNARVLMGFISVQCEALPMVGPSAFLIIPFFTASSAPSTLVS